ncbi:hypothetical protein V2J09_022212 [Rumex salicifolius]
MSKAMHPRVWHKVAALSGVTALGLGTFGAHGLADGFSLPFGTHGGTFSSSDHSQSQHFWRPFSSWDSGFLRDLEVEVTSLNDRLAHSHLLYTHPIPSREHDDARGLSTSAEVVSIFSKNSGARPGHRLTVHHQKHNRCYAVAYLEDRTYGRLAPFGGFAFIGAWASLLF